MKSLAVFVLILSFGLGLGQENREKAMELAREAIALMDAGEVDKSIKLLEECKEIDPTHWIYDYELAYAFSLKEDYQNAIITLSGIKGHPDINSQVYQMSGNSYSYLGDKETALAEYRRGIEKFPDSPNLYVEIGNLHLQKEEYDEAIEQYRKGIQVGPMYAPNYYRLSKLFLQSTDKLHGLIYGEIYLNLDRSSSRTNEISELLFKGYKEAIQISGDSIAFDFCEIVFDTDSLQEDEAIKLPFCMVHGVLFGRAAVDLKEVSLSSLSRVRTGILTGYIQDHREDYPNILYEYQQRILEAGHFEAYNHYFMQIGAEEEFDAWVSANRQAFDDFIEWYVREENHLQITLENAFVRF